MGQLEALIFDVDGTLAETERDGHRIAFNHAFNEANLNWQWDVNLYGELLKIGGGKERIGHYIKNYIEFEPPYNLDEFIVNLHQSKNKFYQELLNQGTISLRPGVKNLITETHDQGIRLAIATTSTLSNALALLEANIDPNYFEIIAAGDIVAQKKPAPDIYLYVLEKLNLSPEKCVVIEDSEAGLQAANQAGLKTIITVNDYTINHNFDLALKVINSLEEINLSDLQKLIS